MKTERLYWREVEGLEAVVRGREGPEGAGLDSGRMYDSPGGDVVNPDGRGSVEDGVGGIQDAGVAEGGGHPRLCKHRSMEKVVWFTGSTAHPPTPAVDEC